MPALSAAGVAALRSDLDLFASVCASGAGGASSWLVKLRPVAFIHEGAQLPSDGRAARSTVRGHGTSTRPPPSPKRRTQLASADLVAT